MKIFKRLILPFIFLIFTLVGCSMPAHERATTDALQDSADGNNIRSLSNTIFQTASNISNNYSSQFIYHEEYIYQGLLNGDKGATIIPGDYDGDGKTDFIRQEKNRWDDNHTDTFSVYFSNGDGTFNIITPAGDQYQINLKGDAGCNIISGDYNGDGKDDFIRQEKNMLDNDETDTFSVYFSNGDGTFYIVTPLGNIYQHLLRGDNGAYIYAGDYNGDGKDDFIRQEFGGWDDDGVNTFSVYFSNGDGTFNMETPIGDMYQHLLRGDNGANIIPGDYNGDGKDDFIRQERREWDDDGINTFNVYFSNGDGTFNMVTPEGTIYQHLLKSDDGANIISGDFNGDGKSDFIRQEGRGWDDDAINTFNIYYSNGDGTFNVCTPIGAIYQELLRWDFGCNIIAGDYNGDGKSDFIRQEKGQWANDPYHTFTVYMTN